MEIRAQGMKLSPAILVDGEVWAGPNHGAIASFLSHDPETYMHGLTLGFSCGGQFVTREEAEELVGARYACDREMVRPYPNIVRVN